MCLEASTSNEIAIIRNVQYRICSQCKRPISGSGKTVGGHAVFVVKSFVRDKKIVDFPGQWAQLCEAVGFRLLHHHRASLVEHSGTQGGFDEDKEIRVERKSFFRRLAEAKGSPRIDHESVLCFERI